MKFSFDYYHNLEDVDLYLCNPDGRQLFTLLAVGRNLKLRFNDLSELTFDYYSTTTDSNGNVVPLDAYDYVQTKRLVYATKIGMFQITNVAETDDGTTKHKSVTCESYQSVLKNKGFRSEERVYSFYNPNDPHDDNYDDTNEASIPSVVGQLYRQLGIKLSLSTGINEPSTPFDDWTITYISPSLYFDGETASCRTFDENATTGYDFIVNDVEKAFEIAFVFDFVNNAIHVMTPAEITDKSSVMFTFSNFMKDVQVTENSDDIVTVMSCNGDGCDIRGINPTGMNYICDFSYFMDSVNKRWMSDPLITKLQAWQEEVEAQEEDYSDLYASLVDLYLERAVLDEKQKHSSVLLTDLEHARDKRIEQLAEKNAVGDLEIEDDDSGGDDPSGDFSDGMTQTCIDVSIAQGDIDWKAVNAAGYHYAMIKATQGHGVTQATANAYLFDDRRFIYNIQSAAECGIQCGVYHYFTARTIAEADEEAEFFIETISPYQDKITLWAAVDVEELSYLSDLSRETLTSVVRRFITKVSNAGFNAMLYANPDFLTYRYTPGAFDDVPIWIAHWRVPSPMVVPKTKIWQYGVGNVEGISTYVDLNVIYEVPGGSEPEPRPTPEADLSFYGIVGAETIAAGEKSLDAESEYYQTEFDTSDTFRAHSIIPTYNKTTKTWSYATPGTLDTAENHYAAGRYYFIDADDSGSYCKLNGKSGLNTDGSAKYECSGFTRYVSFDRVPEWIAIRTGEVNTLNAAIAEKDESISTVNSQMETISSRLNVVAYFSNTPDLFKELSHYWIEADYTNDKIKALDTMSGAQVLELSKELLEMGKTELSKVCQPRYSFSLTAVDFFKSYEFRNQAADIELGKIITIEKEEGLWYYPALLEIDMSLDTTDSFSLTFANAARLDDWGFTFADLITDASSAAKKIDSNWQNITAFSKKEASMNSLINNPLSATLRASFANAVNQEFKVDDTGILGRKFSDDTHSSFDGEQVRLLNNLIIFTDDSWETARTALGKIYYQDPDSEEMVTAYGLIGDTIIGSLIMSEKMKVKNEGSTITLDKDGITILNEEETDPDKKVVFHAGIDGSLVVSNYVSDEQLSAQLSIRDGEIEGLVSAVDEHDGLITTMSTTVRQTAEDILLKADKKTVDTISGIVTENTASIKTNADNIALKVSTTTYNANNEVIETRFSSIEETADEIRTSVTSISNLTDTGFAQKLESKISQKADAIMTEVNSIIYDDDRTTTKWSSEISQKADEISAKVSNKVNSDDGNANTFGWSIGIDGTGRGHFYIYNNGTAIFNVSQNGLTVAGNIVAETGYIGNGSFGFTITDSSIYNTKSSYSESGNGVYIGTDGIALGSTFKVSASGNIIANNMSANNATLVGASITNGSTTSGSYRQEIAEGYHNFSVYGTGETFNISPRQLYWDWPRGSAWIRRNGESAYTMVIGCSPSGALRIDDTVSGPWDDISPVAVFG